MTRVFGYGSLIWRPAFAARASFWARLEGWERRFEQGSPDHRGTPERPGRVATIVARPGAQVWGVVYELEERARRSILEALDRRERGGYERLAVEVVDKSGRRLEAITYYARPGNRHWLGTARPEAIARQIARRRGPSGTNAEYLLELERALSRAGHADAALGELARLVRAELGAGGKKGRGGGG